jgi:hypothetical protein
MRDGSMDDIIFKNKWKGLGEGNLEIERWSKPNHFFF